MSMNALLPRTLSAQVCNRAQLHCLRRIRVQGPLGYMASISTLIDQDIYVSRLIVCCVVQRSEVLLLRNCSALL